MSFSLLSFIISIRLMPLCYLARYAEPLHKKFLQHPVIFSPPYNPNIHLGSSIGRISCFAGIGWSIIGLVVLGLWCVVETGRSWGFTIIAFVDLALAAGLFTAAVLQTGYIARDPLGSKNCGAGVVGKWGVLDGAAVPGLFIRLAERHKDPMKSATGYCNEAAIVWRLLIATCITWAITGILLILFLTPPRFPRLKRIISFLKWIISALSWCLPHIVSLPVTLAQCIGKVRLVQFLGGYLEKRRNYHNRISKDVEMAGIRVEQRIVVKVHLIDISNLSHTALPLYHALRTSPVQLCEVSCTPGTKTTCWACSLRICATCEKSRSLHDPPSRRHLHQCKLNCSRCYYRVTLFANANSYRTSNATWGHARECDCASHHWSHSNMVQPRRVCGNCAKEDEDVVLGRRERRELRLLKHLENGRFQCCECKVLVRGVGPSWWVCTRCASECKSDVHIAWRGK
ncbi:hypothetical protein BDD12DRAFT_306786 [Trichophaea hybrida]|nr:hypothetical protein BDD12DRAFT_306786 [Trichophaea hybrida]